MPLSSTLHAGFKHLVQTQPKAPAIIADQAALSYAELDRLSDALAWELYNRGSEPQEPVGVLADRSASLPIAFLGILKAGCVYVPMVADHPAERLAFFARQTGMRHLIVLDGTTPPALLLDVLAAKGECQANRAIIRPEEVFARNTPLPPFYCPPCAMDDLAAILFTSGSTGTPKGVMLHHGGCANMANGHIKAHGITCLDRILLSTSPGFILGFRELCLPLMSGAAFVPASRALIDEPAAFVDMMSRHRVSIALLTPSYLRLFNGAVPQGLRCIITAGERPNGGDARHYGRQIEYWNVHGATEVCGTICMYRVNGEATDGPIPSGRPFANTRVYLLDDQHREVPKGGIGEVYIIGAGVARGYLNQPELTARSFVDTPFGRAFRTNDMARWNSDGNLETLGRADDVIKISGQSVPLGEIEQTLVSHPAVQRAAALQLDGRLVACVETPQPAAAKQVDWRLFLGKSLPSYMIPAEVAVVAKMPISSAGKIDRKTLKDTVAQIFVNQRHNQQKNAPQGALEQIIAQVWEEVIGTGPVMREDNFFFIGGTSLMAIEVSQRLLDLGHRVSAQMVLASLNVKELTARIAEGDHDPASASNGMEHAHLDSGQATMDQQGFWIAAELGLPSGGTHIVRVLQVKGDRPAPEAWATAWQSLIDHHPALRTAFTADGEPPLSWRTFAPSALPDTPIFTTQRYATLQEAGEALARRAAEKISLDMPPLVRAGLIEVCDELLFWCVLHHSVVDGVSSQLLLDDYLTLLGWSPLPPAVHGIALASRIEQQYLASSLAARDREFWHARLEALAASGAIAFEEYVAEQPRPQVPSGQGTPPLCRHLGPETVVVLGQLAKKEGAGLHALLLALLAHEVRRRRGPGPLMIGSGISTRPAGGESAIGHFVNLLPVIVENDATPSLAALVARCQQALTETIDHGSYPSTLMQRQFMQLHPELRPQSRTSLFDIGLTSIMPRTRVDRAHNLRLSPRFLPGLVEYPAAGLDLSFSHEPCPDEDGGLNLLLTWNGDVCSQQTAEAWLDGLAAWANWLGEEPERFARALPPLLPQEAALLAQWERGREQDFPQRCGHELFEEMVACHPQAPAIIDNGCIETFAALDQRADAWAAHLHKQGIVPGAVVAVLGTVSPDLPAAILAIWKAGAVYLPLPQEQPATRLREMAETSAATALLVLDELPVPPALAAHFANIASPRSWDLTSRLPRSHRFSPEAPAYIIFTSGTTGKPKGIAISHASFTSIIRGVGETVGLRDDDRVALVSTIGFDASLWELGMGLCLGLPLVPIRPALRDDPWAMKQYYHQWGVTVAFHTPSYLRPSEDTPFAGLRILLTGGEAPSLRDIRHHAGSLAMWNFYGPTETTIVAAGGRIEPISAQNAVLTVGRPLPNVHISLRHHDGSPVLPGQRGEVWIGGVGVAPGYLQLAELTAERFVTLAEGRFYRSGDYGRWTADGRLAIIGRMDSQVKINGQRVELGEVEHVLASHPAVADAVVLNVATESGNKAQVLYGFVRCDSGNLDQSDLSDFLVQRLPLHMVPAAVIRVPAIPLLPSGKIDRQALLAHLQHHSAGTGRELPQGDLEVAIAPIWAEVLGVPVGRNDNFFALGGHSLLAVTLAHRVSQRLGRQIPARSLFTAPTLAAFAAAINRRHPVEPTAGHSEEPDLATVGELEFWTAEAAGLDTRTFTIPAQYLVLKDATPEQWHEAWSILVARHEGLRTFFAEDASGQLRRRVAATVDVSVESTECADKTAARTHIRRRQTDTLPMGSAPLWRVGLVREQAEGALYFWLALHHAVGDGQSVGTLLSELTLLLEGEVLPAPPEGPGTLASREQAYLASPDATADAHYWDSVLQQIPSTAFNEWPLDRARSLQVPAGNHRFSVAFNAQTAKALKALARSHATSIHALMLTLLALEVRRRTDRTDVLIGTTASIRESTADMRIVGFGVNMLPLHLNVTAAPCLSELLRATQERLAQALGHARYPFAHIYRTFWSQRPELRHPQRYPLFDIAVTENPSAGSGSVPQRFSRAITATETVHYECTEASPGQDMVLIHEELDNGGLALQLQCNAALYSRETAQHWLEALVGWVHWLSENPDRAGQRLPSLLPQEAKRLAQWEQGRRVERPQVRFHELFEQVVDRPNQAQRAAVITQEEQCSYRELDEAANALAHALLQRGTGPGSVVAVLTGRSAHLPAAALAVWKSGAIYLPLAADLPPERLAFMAGDARVSQLIVLDGAVVPEPLASNLPEPLRPEALTESYRRAHATRPQTSGAPSDIAYILYTSGSTGLPKGTLIGHDSYVNLALGVSETYGLTVEDRCLMFASPSFDVSLSDIGVPLACGAAICPVSSMVVESPSRFLRFLDELGITLADITPTYLRLFEGRDLPPSLRILVTGGEPPVPKDVATYAPRLQFYNAYGPTENTITSCMARLRGDAPGLPAAGRPLPNTSIHICNAQGEPLPPAMVGEIWLGGAGLSRGYLQRPDLTTAHFQETAFGRRYRSGDLGRWNADGELEILGRIDDQVKLNGIRIELGEIEHALSGHEAVAQAVALLVEQEGGSKSLWAVVRPLEGADIPSEEDWRLFLSKRLPAHMLPSGVHAVDTIPLSASGKIDRAALLDLLAKRPVISELPLPQDVLEQCIAEVWSDVLGLNPIHREDNFFALGGHSLLAIVVAHKLENVLGREVPARELFAAPTLSAFADRLRIAGPANTARIASDRATEGQREFWIAEQTEIDTRGFHIALNLRVNGAVPPPQQWINAWDGLVARHDMLRTGFVADKDGELRRLVVEQPEAEFTITSVTSQDEALRATAAQLEIPFAMNTPGLWRAGLIQVTESGTTIFWLVLHHAVGDGLSLGILLAELAQRLRGDIPATPLIGFDRSADREATYLAGAAARADAAFWRQRLTGLLQRAPDALEEWPLDKARPKARSIDQLNSVHCCRHRLEPELADGLRHLARRNGASLHAAMLALVGLTVKRLTGRSSFLLGTAASTRHSAAEAGVIGYFVNMLPLCVDHDNQGTVDAAVCAMQRELGEALQHCAYPFSRIYGDFRREHPQTVHPARYPLFDIAVTENPAINASQDQALSFAPLHRHASEAIGYERLDNGPAQDLVLVHEGQNDQALALTWYANAGIYTQDTALTWFESLLGLIRYVVDTLPHPGEPLPSLLPEEARQLHTWQKGARRVLPCPSFPELFRRLAQKQPHRPAIITATSTLSYQAINDRSDRLARTLLDCTLQRGEPVAVLTERSATLPETVLGLWKAGGCYLPLTADLPGERLAFMAKDAGVRLLIVLDGLALPEELLDGPYTIIRPEETAADTPPAPPLAVAADDLAYILYTSGSTGVPKGVMLRHAGMLNLGLEMSARLGITSEDRALLMASPSFDLWISDLVVAWSAGAALVPISREAMNDIEGMKALFRQHGVTVATMSPSYLRLFARYDFPGLRVLMTVGESPFSDDVRHYAARLAYFNGYGPTENSAATTAGRLQSDAEQIVAGRPLANMTLAIVDADGNPVPPGVAGEVRVSGIGLAAGYLNRPELDAASFLDTPQGRTYRTGDLGRWLRTGDLHILGRVDTQVKLRGQRVELGEIEHCLEACPGVRQAVVAVETLADQSHRLRAFVVLSPQALAPEPEQWKHLLAQRLPSYMIPATILRVEKMPLNAAGKVDRRALLSLAVPETGSIGARLTPAEATVPTACPQTAVAKRVAEIWGEFLPVRPRTVDDDFFNLGGDSLKAISVISRLRLEFVCSVNDLYEHSTLADFAGCCRPLSAQSATPREDRHVHSSVASESALQTLRAAYAARMHNDLERDLHERHDYRHILLTGATGYLGSYLLREFLKDPLLTVTALVRGHDNRMARIRLNEVLSHYFGETPGSLLADHPRLHVLAGDLRHAALQLAPNDHGRLVETVDAIYHCAANVAHIGHYDEFHADNVVATRNLLALAAQRTASPPDFHFVSTVSIAGRGTSESASLFSEYDPAPETPDDNYYIRTKQEAERLVVAARGTLANACIHRVGNIGFATDSGRLQRNIDNNAFFRHLVAFLRLGIVPEAMEASISHVDIVAHAIAALSSVKTLSNATHHIQTGRQDRLADFIRAGDVAEARTIRACGFADFVQQLRLAMDDPALESAASELMEAFALHTGPISGERPRPNRLSVTAERTNLLLERLGISWPAIPATGRNAVLHAASERLRP